MPSILEQFSPHALARGALATALILLVYTVVSRLFAHPLKAFPGPRLAALTDFYAAYYEVWKDGRFATHLKELHLIYGPVVRIRPNELHFSTPKAYFEIYPPHSGFTKDRNFYSGIGLSESSFGFIDVKDHKKRRDLINPLFSRRGILKFERNIQDNVSQGSVITTSPYLQKIDLFVQRLREYSDEPVNFKCGFRALTMDIITMYSYGYTLGGIDAPGFDHPYPNSLNSAVVLMAASRYMSWLHAVQWLPPVLFKMLKPSMAGFAYLRSSARRNVEAYLASPESFHKADHETIYHHLLPESEDRSQWPTKASLVDEAVTLIGAGMDTTSNALNIGLFHLLRDGNDQMRKRLEDELSRAWPEKDSPFSFEQAEKLPYLTGVVKESLRLSIGLPLPLSRLVVAPTMIDDVYVPAGAVVSVSSKFILLNPEIFPEPDKFMPERWMQSNSVELDKHLVVFSRGPRSCLGMNLAWCEMYLVISHLIRKFDVKLHDTTVHDMDIREYIIPSWRGKGLHAVVKERNE